MTDTVRLEAGQLAPDFTLTDQNGRKVTLSALRGRKVIVYFYGEASTPACTAQACDFEESLGTLESAGYAVLGISRDQLPAIEKFAAAQGLTFPLLSDPGRAVHELYGAYGEKKLYGRVVHGVIRSTFVLDEHGVITMALYGIKATGHVAMLRRRLGLAA
ncbi:peroxiredoxin [Lysinimonas soli]|uniref:thioredoxin-dependent peroxiredoxin n=1 Tax=Lysinimonas soli TaxID=1074233 RepID=A0ABW0NS18_9MICO